MTNLRVSLACCRYDRTQAVLDGRATAEGVTLTTLALEPEELFYRAIRYQEFDICELSLSAYVASLTHGQPFVGLPIFPSRSFRHNGIYVNSRAGIKTPADLTGKRVGLGEYQIAANVWIRGILADRHGLPITAPSYHTGGLHEPGRVEKIPIAALPSGVRVAAIPVGSTLSELLLAGELDAIYTPRIPRAYQVGDSRIERLFTDVRSAEARYFAETGLFPIMHVVVMRRRLYEENPWLARSIFGAFNESLRMAFNEIGETAAPRSMLPWAYLEAENAQVNMGSSYWAYGLTPTNAANISTFLRYCAEQGISPEQVSPEDLFVPELLTESHI
jgi:4,5-dihydroxyphthalate decarboxylase